MASSCLLLILLITFSVSTAVSQPSAVGACNGISMSYVYNSGHAVPPFLLASDSTNQPYRFQSTLTILNNSPEKLKSWRVFVEFQHREFLVSASNAVLADGTPLPADVSNGTVLSGYPVTDLKSAIETAGDWNQMQAVVELVGTQFGVGPSDVPLPSSLSLANDGFRCSSPTKQGDNGTSICCAEDSNDRSNSPIEEQDLLLPQKGDVSIMYDVIGTYETNYWAQVTISNHNPIGRLDNWRLSWEWMRDEFIFAMKGAFPDLVYTTRCIYGPQGEYYKAIDFSKALNCERRPIILDLPVDKTNDTNLGMIPFCCRNGTILPPTMDPARSKSVFQMQVYKMPPDLNRTRIFPPQNWKISGTDLNPEYQCRPPQRVSPSLFPDPNGLPLESAAVASWQVVCNITRTNIDSPKCCVSFSAFFNDSVVPCDTCACGCNPNPDKACSATAPAVLLPPEALLIPFENRSKKAMDFARENDIVLPHPLPCGDNCGISINWHLLSDYDHGWTARLTLFNWGETDFADWFAAVQLERAMPGYEAVYSFNASVIPASGDDNNTIFLQGRPGLNYLMGETDGDDPRKDPRLPGVQQSVILFTKKRTPGINVARGDGFPSKVFFNGEECSLPTRLPNGCGHGIAPSAMIFSLPLALLVLLSLQQLQCQTKPDHVY